MFTYALWRSDGKILLANLVEKVCIDWLQPSFARARPNDGSLAVEATRIQNCLCGQMAYGDEMDVKAKP